MTNQQLLEIPADTKQQQIIEPHDQDEDNLPPPPEYEEIDSNPQPQSQGQSPLAQTTNSLYTPNSQINNNLSGGSNLNSNPQGYIASNHSGSSSTTGSRINDHAGSGNANGPTSLNVPHHPNFYNSNSSSSSAGTAGYTGKPTDNGKKPDDLYTSNLDLPWRYPKGYFCSKCKNTGYRVSTFRGKSKQCSDCWRKFHKPKPLPSSSSTTQRPRPQQFPQIPVPLYTGFPPNVAPMNINPGMAPVRPLVLQPGDPRIGGELCPQCRGRGLIQFFLDTETCTTCRGIGRVMY